MPLTAGSMLSSHLFRCSEAHLSCIVRSIHGNVNVHVLLSKPRSEAKDTSGVGGAGCDATTDNIMDAIIPPPQYINSRIHRVISNLNKKEPIQGKEVFELHLNFSTIKIFCSVNLE